MTAPLLEMRAVSVMRGSRIALHDINLRIEAEEHVAILGPNGCGKSTLVKAITRECYPLARPDSSIAIYGQSRWNVWELRSHLGIVSSDLTNSCARDITGLEAVLSGFFSSIGVPPHTEVDSVMTSKAEAALQRLDASHLAERAMTEMSSGEARRVLLARALVHSPQALLLDEPSTALDLSAQHELRETLRNLARSGIAIVLITHHLDDIIPEIDRVVLMQSGRIVGDGPKPEMLTSERLSPVFRLPVHVGEQAGYYHAYHRGASAQF